MHATRWALCVVKASGVGPEGWLGETRCKERAVLWESPDLPHFTEDFVFSSLLLVWRMHRAALSTTGPCAVAACVSRSRVSLVRCYGVLSWQQRSDTLQHLHVCFPSSSLPSSPSFVVAIPAAVIQETVAQCDGELHSQGGKEWSPKGRSESEAMRKCYLNGRVGQETCQEKGWMPLLQTWRDNVALG